MSDEDKSSKSEQPTDKRMDQAKNKGQVPRSQEINSWAMLFGMVMALIYIFPWTMNEIALLNLQFFQTPHTMPMDNDHIRFLFMDVGKSLGLILTPIFALFVVLGLTVSVLQTGWTFSFEKLELKLNALSPLTGVKKLVGTSAMVEFVKGLIKFIVVGTLVFAAALPLLADVELLPGFELMDILDRIRDIALLIVSLTLVIMTVVAALDFVYQKWKTKDDLKMSKNEVKDENKQSEGDPKVKARIAQIRMERAQQRIVAATIRADVVITNPTHFAIALKYELGEMDAPVCIAKGVDHLAFRIRGVAEEHDVPIVENPPLARALYDTVELDQEIPPEHFTAVAEIIGYIMRQRGDLPMH